MGDRELQGHGEVATYPINEIFYSLQGEGVRAGEPSVFVRFSGCNRRCTVDEVGFDCDTRHEEVAYRATVQEVLREVHLASGSRCKWVVFTGGEPLLHLDAELVGTLMCCGFEVAVETNGTIPLRFPVSWLTVSPKGKQVHQDFEVDEVKFVVAAGQPLPKLEVEARHKLLSPAFRGGELDHDALAWCISLVKENPTWRLSVQQHKLWGVR